jgi:spore coat polysaccharide biosynthesis predicted glycosyltransferase SpsG
MRLIFRVNASNSIGAGHVMRVAVIAEELKKRGIDCFFVGSLGNIDWLVQHFSKMGIIFIDIESEFINQDFSRDILIIDSYEISINEPFISPDKWRKVVVIIDKLTPKYSAHLYIHMGINGNEIPLDCNKYFWGLQYVPIRNTIKKRSIFSIKEVLDTIIVVGGGTDVSNLSLALAPILSNLNGFKKAIFVSDKKREIELIDKRFEIIEFNSDIDELLNNSDLVFTTASTISLEMIAREIPIGVVCAVENQSATYLELSKRKLALAIGKKTSNEHWVINTSQVKKLIYNNTVKTEIIKNMHDLIDFKGASRVVDLIIHH